jgi:hypothetical protein
MLIREVTTPKPTKPKTAADQRVATLKTQLGQAREVAGRQRLAARQARLNQERARLDKLSAQTKPPPCERGFLLVSNSLNSLVTVGQN